jgi:adsorption protein B
MCGIALSGWDRTGWSRAGALADHWMRMKDRSAPLAVLVLAASYLALVLWAVAALVHWAHGTPVPATGDVLDKLLTINAGLLGWRCLMRTVLTARAYGWRESLWSAPRLIVGNVVAILAARRALGRYLLTLRGVRPTWDKTVHAFPETDAAERS